MGTVRIKNRSLARNSSGHLMATGRSNTIVIVDQSGKELATKPINIRVTATPKGAAATAPPSNPGVMTPPAVTPTPYRVQRRSPTG